MNVFLNFDTGVFPAGLIQIQIDLSISMEQIAYLSSVVYIGLSCASLFGTFVFHKFSANYIIAIMVALNSLACFAFTRTEDLFILYALRFTLGFT